MTAVLLASVLLPGALAPLLLIRARARSVAMRLAPWAALPALLAGIVGPTGVVEADWILLGARFGLDGVGRVFLVLSALLWTVSGVYAVSYLAGDPRRARYFAFHLLTSSGNLGAAVALDIVGFYFFFSLMTFAGYGLVVHSGGADAMRAGRVYIALAAAGEAALLGGGILAASAAEGLTLEEIRAAVAEMPDGWIAAGLLMGGFAIKAGLFPLHVWLPLAHPIAPTPASAVLSGCMIKVGLLGWIRVLPLGLAPLPGWGGAMVALGLASVAVGVLAGASQNDPKTVLAYSSTTQMGVVAAAVGSGLLKPEIWPVVLPALLLYVVHHGLAKAALFLGTGLDRPAEMSGGWRVAGLGFLALALAGAPLTSGALAKGRLKEAVHLAPAQWIGWFDVLLLLTAVGTALLMARLLWLVRVPPDAREGPRPAGLWAPWGVLLLATALLPIVGPSIPPTPGPAGVEPTALWSGTWPVLLGALIFLIGVRVHILRRLGGGLSVPPADILIPLEAGFGAAARGLGRWKARPVADPLAALADRWYGMYVEDEKQRPLYRAELHLTHWRAAGALLLSLIAVLLLLLFVR